MAAGDLITTDFQIEYNDVLVGDNDIEIVKFDGLTLPSVRTSDVDRPLDHGQFAGQDYLTGRSFVAEIEVWGNSDAELVTATQAILAATVPQESELPLIFRLPGWYDDLRIDCKPRRRAGPIITEEFQFRKGVVAIEFWATNPRLLGATLKTDSAGIVTTQSGLTFPMTFDLSFGGVSTSANIVASNAGNFPSKPLITITGPVTDPSVENVTAGKVLSLTGELLTGQTLVLDTLNRTVLLGGTASRYSWIDDPTQWWDIAVGDNTIRFQGTTVGSPTLQVDWRDTWI